MSQQAGLKQLLEPLGRAPSSTDGDELQPGLCAHATSWAFPVLGEARISSVLGTEPQSPVLYGELGSGVAPVPALTEVSNVQSPPWSPHSTTLGPIPQRRKLWSGGMSNSHLYGEGLERWEK